MDAVALSRLQFAFTIGFHILWPTLTIGTAWFVTVLSALWWRTGNTVYRDLMRFWMRLFALGFGMGVVTGIVLSYEIGTNWAGFSRSVANVLGPLFAYETMTAFFLEAGFIGIMLFGEGRVSKGAHVFACLMVAMGALISSTWIIAANSWMQTPAGAVADAQGIYHVVSWWDVIFTASFPYRLAHMVCASFLTCSFVIAGVSAFHLWRGQHVAASRTGFSMALWLALVLAPLQIVIGDMHGRNTMVEQPTKLAAMEGLWETTKGPAMTVIAWPDMAAQKNLYAIDIPHLASLYLTHSWDGQVQGLKAVPPADQPYVPVVFFAFRIMAGIGVVLLATAITGFVLRLRGKLFTARWFQILTMATTPLGFLAVLAGWTVTEAGRQPWIIYGALRTADAAAPVAAGAVTTSLLIFFAVYNVLLLAFVWFAGRVALKGPIDTSPPTREHPGMERSTLGAFTTSPVPSPARGTDPARA
ncbi:cytochrome ubiquinol oxidase subunit I [Ancylobacter rudongensis]|uniref:Cytochrome bd-I ubiquinol oxidase subunit 1 apoprotein n=1 Tax=Ancylobacter rudongensis TaxID=177413 RepID=A0A1G4RGU8_9HYPH|nr:cytochrome ubiquinol oxidase subunit I [Ancylobacter rudongensis]SCW55996.1 cytochrome bd-I ubiquinol oxidase subunit 1 apoprotein [Ancylobacter rudongensis]